MRENDLKILVVGPFNSGKTTLINTVCDSRTVKTEAPTHGLYRVVKEMTTVALDYGSIRLGNKKVHLFGTPGQERFSFMWHVLARGLDGFIMLIDGSDPKSVEEAARIYKVISDKYKAPHIILVNEKSRRRVSEEEIRKLLNTNAPIKVASATKKEEIRNILKELTELLRKEHK
ncbi:MAG: GTP-binding protein [Thermofilum sp. ex4484_82]|nr:MAG: GTP-binding protein [Thermofilum sp. ex4484_82]OYT38507.1 MAG: GTP-binding protein [Archaeoglobales archaeon ex4484_92]